MILQRTKRLLEEVENSPSNLAPISCNSLSESWVHALHLRSDLPPTCTRPDVNAAFHRLVNLCLRD